LLAAGAQAWGQAAGGYVYSAPRGTPTASPPSMPRGAGYGGTAGPGGSTKAERAKRAARTQFVDRNLKDAVAAMRAKDWAGAERACSRVTSLVPRSTLCWTILGEARLNQGDLKGARKAFERSLQLDSENIAVIGQLGVTLARLDQRQAAQAQLDDLRARRTRCGGACSSQTLIEAGITGIEAALAPKA
jgi:TolA-binding protein